mmetsp:Transcript_44418/g.117412  ORF Transcript_44418/g.117412 Transcript_44418/m.117412 type:complete len:1353 (-) Transcript_44418:57-4115(-)
MPSAAGDSPRKYGRGVSELPAREIDCDSPLSEAAQQALELLKHNALLSKLTTVCLERLVRHLAYDRAAPGSVVAGEGVDPNSTRNSAIFLLEGELVISKAGMEIGRLRAPSMWDIRQLFCSAVTESAPRELTVAVVPCANPTAKDLGESAHVAFLSRQAFRHVVGTEGPDYEMVAAHLVTAEEDDAAQDAVIDSLKRVGAMGVLSEKCFATVTGKLEMRLFYPGDVIFSGALPDDPKANPWGLYVVGSGTARVTMFDVEVRTISTNSSFGVDLLLFDAPLNPTMEVVAKTRCQVGILHRHLWKTIMQRFEEERHYFNSISFPAEPGAKQSLVDVPMFRGYPDETFDRMLQYFEKSITFPAQVVVNIGESIGTCVMVNSGRVSVQASGSTVSTIHHPVVFAVESLCGFPTTAGATLAAQTSCDIRLLHPQVFQHYFTEEHIDAVQRHTNRMPACFNMYPEELGRMMMSAARPTVMFKGQALKCHEAFSEDRDTPWMAMITHGSVARTLHDVVVYKYDPGRTIGEAIVLGFPVSDVAQLHCSSLCVEMLMIDMSDLASCLAEREDMHAVVDRVSRQFGRNQCRAVEFLAGGFLDQHCSARFLAALEEVCFQVVAYPGEDLFHKGTKQTHVVTLMSGDAATQRVGVQNAQLAPGAVLGDLLFLNVEVDHPATVRCKSACDWRLCHIHSIEKIKRAFAADGERLNEAARTIQDDLAAARKEQNEAKSVLRHAFFSGCSDGFLQELVPRLESRLYLPGQVFFTQGAEGSWMGILNRGVAIIEFNGNHIGTIGNGHCFGEVAVMGLSNVRTATIRAETVCDVRALHHAPFSGLLETFPEEKMRFEKIAAERISKLGDFGLSQLSFFKDAPDEFISMVQPKLEARTFYPDDIVISQQDASQWIGIVTRGRIIVEREDGTAIGEITNQNPVFGEFTALGLARQRGATLRAKTVVDVRVLHRADLLEALAAFPSVWRKFEDLATERMSLAVSEGNVNPDRFFKGCEGCSLERLVMQMPTKIYWPNQVLIAQGQHNDNVLVLVHGVCAVYLNGVKVKEVTEPQCFNAAAVAEQNSSKLTVRALTVCQTRLASRSKFCFPPEREAFERSLVDLRVMELNVVQALQKSIKTSRVKIKQTESENSYIQRQKRKMSAPLKATGVPKSPRRRARAKSDSRDDASPAGTEPLPPRIPEQVAAQAGTSELALLSSPVRPKPSFRAAVRQIQRASIIGRWLGVSSEQVERQMAIVAELRRRALDHLRGLAGGPSTTVTGSPESGRRTTDDAALPVTPKQSDELKLPYLKVEIAQCSRPIIGPPPSRKSPGARNFARVRRIYQRDLSNRCTLPIIPSHTRGGKVGTEILDF